jgi:hypothetical protein
MLFTSCGLYRRQTEGSAADMEGTIQQGDRIMEVNKEDLRSATQEQAAQILKVISKSKEKISRGTIYIIQHGCHALVIMQLHSLWNDRKQSLKSFTFLHKDVL